MFLPDSSLPGAHQSSRTPRFPLVQNPSDLLDKLFRLVQRPFNLLPGGRRAERILAFFPLSAHLPEEKHPFLVERPVRGIGSEILLEAEVALLPDAVPEEDGPGGMDPARTRRRSSPGDCCRCQRSAVPRPGTLAPGRSIPPLSAGMAERAAASRPRSTSQADSRSSPCNVR